MLKKLDPLLHSELRLSVMSLLISLTKADFTYLKEQTKATSGNLSVQITNLEQAGYITVEKKFNGKMPQTICSITKKGVIAFEQYVNDLKEYLKI
ncbi:MAG: transcriptional regulator [Bacteroidales bacterium]|jgi:predicted transcriptional regulator